MICEYCKERPATVTIQRGTPSGIVEQHFCETCAHQLNYSNMLSNDEPISIQQLLSQWFGGEALQKSPNHRRPATKELTCSGCNVTYREFLTVGKFGCATCYETFREYVPSVFRKLHSGHSSHIGKIPLSFNKRFAVKKQIEEIRTKMQEAVATENFEKAAALRDEANALQAHLDSGGEEADVD